MKIESNSTRLLVCAGAFFCSNSLLHSTTTWNTADDDLSNGGAISVTSSGFDLNVSETSQPETGDGFSLNVVPTGGAIELGVSGRNSPTTSARFTVTVPAGETMVSNIRFFVDFDLNVFPLNHDLSAGGNVEALVSLRQTSGDDLEGDLSFGDLLVTPDPMASTFAPSAAVTDNGGGNFTLRPGDATQGRANVFSLNGTNNPQFGEFELNIKPAAGGNFTPGTQFIVTFDAGYTVRTVPEPTALSFLLVCSIGLFRKKRR